MLGCLILYTTVMFYLAVTGFAVGIGIATITDVNFATVAFISLVAFVIAVVARRHQLDTFAQQLSIIAAVLFAIVVGLIRTDLYSQQFAQSIFAASLNQEVLFSGQVIREPDEREKSTHLYLRTGSETVLTTIDRHIPVSYGDELLIKGTIEKPESFETEFGRVFNYEGYLKARDVTHVVRYADVVVLSSNNGNPIVSQLLLKKEKLTHGIESIIKEPDAGLAEGLLLGMKQSLGDKLEKAFRQSGIIHIVVLSGYNVMLVVAFFSFFLKRLPRLWRLLLGLIVISSFALLVGLSATVVRASLMAVLVLIANTFSRSYDVMRALFFAGFVMLVLNPYLLLYDISFQLSFMATLGLILIAPRLETRLAEGHWFGAKEFLLATVATQIAVLPLLLYHIGEVSIIAIMVNLLVLPAVPAAMFGAFLTGILSFAPVIAVPVGYLTSLVLSYIIFSASWFASLPFATITTPPFSAVWIPIMYAVMTVFYFLLFVRLRETNSLRDWEIVEEVHEDKGVVSKETAPKDTLPIYFR